MPQDAGVGTDALLLAGVGFQAQGKLKVLAGRRGLPAQLQDAGITLDARGRGGGSYESFLAYSGMIFLTASTPL